ncbi:hypothetical protein [Amycolatopsis sp. NPDC057786]
MICQSCRRDLQLVRGVRISLVVSSLSQIDGFLGAVEHVL